MEAPKKQAIIKRPKIAMIKAPAAPHDPTMVNFKTGLNNFLRKNPSLKITMVKHIKAVKNQLMKAIPSGMASQDDWNKELAKF